MQLDANKIEYTDESDIRRTPVWAPRIQNLNLRTHVRVPRIQTSKKFNNSCLGAQDSKPHEKFNNPW